LISGVVEGGPVANGPIQVGDIVTSFNGRAIAETRDLTRIVAESPIGEPLDVVILRDGKEQTVQVTLGRLEDDEVASNENDPETTVEPNEEGTPPDADGQEDQSTPPADQPGPDDPAPEQETPGDAPEAPDQAEQTAPVTEGLIGVELSALDDANRVSFSIAQGVEGVLITRVLPGSKAEGKGLKVGEVIVEVAQEFMKTPQQVAEKLTSIKGEGRRSGYLMIADKDGNLRLVAVPLE
jgi:serine protease Do